MNQILGNIASLSRILKLRQYLLKYYTQKKKKVTFQRIT